MADPSLIPYGATDTQFGIVTESTSDGGVILTVPFAHGFFGHNSTIENTLRKVFHQFPYRAILTLDRTGFTFVEPFTNGGGSEQDGARHVHYAFDTVGEIRKNRYSAGVYVSIPGRANFDLLTDLDDRVVHFISDTLEQTLARLREPPKMAERV